MESYAVVTCIGKGSSGAVYLARSDKIKKLVAIKKIEIDESRRSRCKKSVIREANILQSLNHFHIVICYEWFLSEKSENISMVLEYCNGGTLQDRIESAQKANIHLDEGKVLEWITQITSAVSYIHERKILHRDLKSENVFLLKNGVAKLGDFGISKEINHTLDKANTCVGTPCYLSPELCKDIPYSFKSDIWALGCLLFEMCALKPAFDAANLISLFYKIVQVKYSPLPESTSPQIRELIAKILVQNPTQRPTAADLLKLPILQKYAAQVRLQSSDSVDQINLMSDQKESVPEVVDKWGDLDDLDELLKQTEDEFLNGPNKENQSFKIPSLTNNARSFSVRGDYRADMVEIDGANSLNEYEESRPQTCPHSAVRREETVTPTDTIATWSGYGDRGSRRPSGRANISLSSSSDESDYDSYSGSKINTQRQYSSDDFSSSSDDENTVNTARTTATIDEEIPEVLEASDEGEESPRKLYDSSGFLGITPSRNLPGSSWLQSKRAQVLRQNPKPGPNPVVISTVTRHSIDMTGSYAKSRSSNYGNVTIMNSCPPPEVAESNKHVQRRKKLPGSSWLKRNSESSSDEIVLGEAISGKSLSRSRSFQNKEKKNMTSDQKNFKAQQRENGLILESCSSTNEYASSPEKHSFCSDTNRSAYDVDYADDFEDDDDDDDFNQTRTLTPQVSSLEFVKQRCVDTIGQEAFNQLTKMFKRGMSIGEAYKRHKGAIDFETLETCYLLLK
ncbi:uncharacterized protein LOC143446019 [Clavelina lepadiformis]|uniref:uncharacterized protein LOC143446019 n=1 Tax=Clavelina lepadiformis TaxID=159417 RepID=UPI004042F767